MPMFYQLAYTCNIAFIPDEMPVMIYEQNMGEFPVMAISELRTVPGPKVPG